ncbi:hypothetical protein [Solilutibacter oculi]|nr:hypothetical protein [Lysobacter oculi]
MQRIRRHRSFLRTALLVLVVLGMLIQPALAALGDLHEIEHAAALHSDHGHAHHDGHEVPADDKDAPGDPLGIHSLLHPSGAAASMALIEPVVLLPSLMAEGESPVRAYASGPPMSRLTLPFRPPIA